MAFKPPVRCGCKSHDAVPGQGDTFKPRLSYLEFPPERPLGWMSMDVRLCSLDRVLADNVQRTSGTSPTLLSSNHWRGGRAFPGGVCWWRFLAWRHLRRSSSIGMVTAR